MQHTKPYKTATATEVETKTPNKSGKISNRPYADKPDEPYALDTANAAAFLGVSKSHLEKLRIENPECSPPYFRVGRCIRYPVRRLMDWAEQSSCD